MSFIAPCSTMASSTCLTSKLPELINDLDNVREALDNRKNGTLIRRNVRILSFDNFKKQSSKGRTKNRRVFPKIKSTFFSSFKSSPENAPKYEFKSFLL